MSVTAILDQLIRRQLARLMPITQFNLNRRMADLEAVLEFFRNIDPKCIARIAARHYQMGGQCGFGRAHAPDM